MKSHAPDAPGIVVPRPYRVRRLRADTPDTVTVVLDPVEAPIDDPAPGQFTMLSGFGTGEVPISVSAMPTDGEGLTHTIRSAGAATQRLTAARPGTVFGVRGPFGTGWPSLTGDTVVVAGGIGLAPLLPAIRRLADRPEPDRLSVLVGARRPSELLVPAELEQLAARHQVLRTVDSADRTWTGAVGVVTELVRRVETDWERASALVCGPEVMIRFTARALEGAGLDPARIWVSLERNMHCGHGACGHCQLGPFFLCTDGPVVSWARVAPVLAVRSR